MKHQDPQYVLHLLWGALLWGLCACSVARDEELPLANSASLTLQGPGVLFGEGAQGGPFQSTPIELTVSNDGDAPLDWSVSSTADWIMVSSTGGTLLTGMNVVVTLAIDEARAATFGSGTYEADIEFLDETNGGSGGSVEGLLTVSADGWTLFTESIDTRKVHVSSSTGNDSNSGLSPSDPKRTIAAGRTLMRDGFPDWLLLRRGDTWDEAIGRWITSGRSAAEPTLISSYGDAIERPYLRTGSSSCIFTSGPESGGPSIDYVAIVGLHMDAHTYTGDGSPSGVMWLTPSTYLLVEDCLIEGYQINVSVPGWGGRSGDVRIRRNVLVDAISTVGTVGHGIYLAGCDDVLIEENLIDHNGWNPSIPGAIPTIFRHGVYIQTGNTGVTARGNIVSNSSSHGIQMRSGGRAEDNLFLRNSIGLLLGGGHSPTGGVSAEVVRNVFIYGKDIDSSNPRGWALNAVNLSSGLISENLIAHSVEGGFLVPVDFYASGGGVGIHQTHFVDNVVYNWGGTFQLQGSPALYTGLRIAGNQFDNRISSSALLSHSDPATTSILQSADNRFFSASLAPSDWIRVGGQTHSVQSWAALVSDPTSFGASDTHPDPTRTLATYDSHIGGAGSLASFLAVARTQSKLNWRPEYTALQANAFIRAGYAFP